MQPPDRRDVLDDLDAPADTAPEFPDHLPLLPLQRLDQQVGVAESDGVGVVDVVRHDVEVEVCLVVGHPQRFLRPDPVGDIRSGTDQSDRATVIIGKDCVLPCEDQFVPIPRDDRVLSPGQGVAARDRGVEDLPPCLSGCFGDDRCKPVLPDKFLLPVAEQLAAVAVDEPDGMIGVDDDEEDARHVEVALREIPLFLQLPLPPFELLGEGGDNEGDDDEHQGAPVIVQRQDIRPVQETADDDEPAEEDGDQDAPLLPPERGQDDREIEEVRKDRSEHQDGVEVVGQEDGYAKEGHDNGHTLVFGKGSHGAPTSTTYIYIFNYIKMSACILSADSGGGSGELG